MALPWALAVLSLLPLLDAHSPACANLTARPITNATLDRISGKWFYIASVFRDPEYKKAAQEIETAYFYFAPNKTEGTIALREYLTIKDKCIYNFSYLDIQWENGTLSRYEFGRENFGHLQFLKDPRTYILAFYPEDEQNRGMSFYADKPEATQEQLEEFYEALACVGISKSEVLHTDWKKNQCEQLERQHEEERKKEKES
ncbi:PREDICTED: alpha-1-acid glycoprotein 1 [Propithecus coquereli]|uniref:Lipocalin/cytosolic fatty-acid binding domain-containing protein n=1 Tax=Propithecus coquereli TaxID=379532 RepID=A0A2K6G335_PROCO|nr:PREDICTED: alpha-1-acid glycoprotein 1 [Propithecus coquereli]